MPKTRVGFASEAHPNGYMRLAAESGSYLRFSSVAAAPVNNNIELQKEEVELVYNDILKTLIEEEFNTTILPNYKDLSPQ